jgi:hypothetical protein
MSKKLGRLSLALIKVSRLVSTKITGTNSLAYLAEASMTKKFYKFVDYNPYHLVILNIRHLWQLKLVIAIHR